MATEQSRPKQKEPSWLARLIPLLQWAPQYERGWLRPDLIAGLTVTALVVPKALGYAGIANVPIQYGLYAAAAGVSGDEDTVALVAGITLVTVVYGGRFVATPEGFAVEQMVATGEGVVDEIVVGVPVD